MGGADIDDVIACVRMPSTDQVFVIDGYNLPYPSHYASVWDWDMSGVEALSSAYNEVGIECSFRRKLDTGDDGMDFPLTLPLYLFYGMANDPISNNGTLSKHSPTPWISDYQVNIAVEMNGSFSVPFERKVFSVPPGCVTMPTDCRLYLAEVILEDEVLVELEGETSGWVAVGYSEDRLMGGDNIDDVIGCLVTGSGHTVVAKDTYNIPNLLNNRDDLVQDDIKLLHGMYQNGRLKCTLMRTRTGSSRSEDVDITNPGLYRFLGSGPPQGIDNTKFGFHGSENIPHILDSEDTVTNQPLSVHTCSVGPLLRVHGILMYLSWGVLGVAAIFMARHMQSALPNRQWIYVHQVLLIMSLFTSATGFVLVFIHFYMVGAVKGLINFGTGNVAGSAHFVLGCVVMAFQIVNPIMAFFRPKKTSTWSCLFHVVHGYVVGTTLQLLAAVVIFLGLYRYGETAGSTYYPPFYLWVVVFMVVMVTEFGLKAYTLITSKTSRASYVKSSQEKPKSIGTEMNGVEGSKQHGKGKTAKLKQIPSKDSPLRWAVFTFILLLTVLSGVSIAALLGIACV